MPVLKWAWCRGWHLPSLLHDNKIMSLTIVKWKHDNFEIIKCYIVPSVA